MKRRGIDPFVQFLFRSRFSSCRSFLIPQTNELQLRNEYHFAGRNCLLLSAKGAEYESQGQARSKAERVAPGPTAVSE